MVEILAIFKKPGEDMETIRIEASNEAFRKKLGGPMDCEQLTDNVRVFRLSDAARMGMRESMLGILGPVLVVGMRRVKTGEIVYRGLTNAEIACFRT